LLARRTDIREAALMSRRRLLLLAVVLPLAGCGSAADEISDVQDRRRLCCR
jgi:hypothetical protein